MLHPIGVRPWQKIRDERVRRLEGRQLAEDGALFTNDPLQRRREPIGIGVAAIVVQRHSKFAVDRKRAQRKRAQLDRAVDQVVKIRGRKRSRIGRGMQLRRDLPLRGRVERDTRRAPFEPARPHERRRNIQVRVGGVDREMRSIQRDRRRPCSAHAPCRDAPAHSTATDSAARPSEARPCRHRSARRTRSARIHESAYRPGDVRDIITSSVPGGTSANVTSTCIRWCWASGKLR